MSSATSADVAFIKQKQNRSVNTEISSSSTSTQWMSLLNSWIISQICQPFINRFLSTIVDKSTENLRLHIPAIKSQRHFGRTDDEANNNNNAYQKGSQEIVTVTIHNPIWMTWKMLLDPKMGLGESYMEGAWSATPNPKEFLDVLIRAKRQNSRQRGEKNSNSIKIRQYLLTSTMSTIRNVAWLVNYVLHRLRDNTVRQSAKNIEDHYDLGNDMFEIFLDNSMTYSCALFEDCNKPYLTSLESAQYKKIDALIDMMELDENCNVLEIGCGWGAFAIRAVQRTGCKWTGLTISHEQLAWGLDKVKEAGLEDKISLIYRDYRMDTGKYDRVVSVEMVEAVGQAFLPQYFQVISDRLKPNGKAVLQGIVCPDAYYENYCKSSDFIKKHIFPGGHMPSRGAIRCSLPEDLQFGEEKSIGLHYSCTLDCWFNTWIEKEDQLKNLGISDKFHRKWQYYFCLCSSLFLHGHIDTIQFSLRKSAKN
ncbi:unnamed protein product [Auanema sp. JU1783]|nr:unnamed protein product [Auanema sp. JU1783]